jgi:hypothetical protein
VDYFIGSNLTVGGEFMVHGRSDSEVSRIANNNSEQDERIATSSAYAIHPRAGYALPFGGIWGLWPHAGLMFAQESREVFDNNATTTSHSSLNLTLDAMFYATPGSHLYLGAGPYWDIGLWGNRNQQAGAGQDQESDYTLTSFGLSFTLGGYF